MEQIELFRFLKLNPVSQKKLKMWEQEIEKKFIILHNIKECYVLIDRNEIKEKERSIKNISHGRVLRPRKKKKRCCVMCAKSK